MSKPANLSSVLGEKTTIRYHSGTNNPNFAGLDIHDNPHKTRDGFIWKMPDGEEAKINFIGKIDRSAFGDKSGPYFSLPDRQFVRAIVTLLTSRVRRLTRHFRNPRSTWMT